LSPANASISFISSFTLLHIQGMPRNPREVYALDPFRLPLAPPQRFLVDHVRMSLEMDELIRLSVKKTHFEVLSDEILSRLQHVIVRQGDISPQTLLILEN